MFYKRKYNYLFIWVTLVSFLTILYLLFLYIFSPSNLQLEYLNEAQRDYFRNVTPVYPPPLSNFMPTGTGTATTQYCPVDQIV